MPVSAATAAPNEKLKSFSQLTGMPIASAASGSSRSERQARPVRELLTNRSATKTTTKNASATYRYETAKTPPCCDRQLVAEEAERVDVEDPERPAGDVVAETLSPFVVSVWKSCRKNSVTIAR